MYVWVRWMLLRQVWLLFSFFRSSGGWRQCMVPLRQGHCWTVAEDQALGWHWGVEME